MGSTLVSGLAQAPPQGASSEYPPPLPATLDWLVGWLANQKHRALANNYDPAGLRVYITRDGGDVYEDAFRKVAVVDGVFKPTLILVGIRLGIERVTPVYWEALKACVQMPQSVGIAG